MGPGNIARDPGFAPQVEIDAQHPEITDKTFIPGGQSHALESHRGVAQITMSVPRRHLAIDERGYAALARQVRSPNRDARPDGTVISLVVVHGISLPPGEFGGDGIVRLFTNRLDAGVHPYFATISQLRVSAHFLIRRDGELIQFVGCLDRAWHAGVSKWKGRERCNDFSIGIELEGADAVPYAPAQYTMLARLIRALKRTYRIDDIVGHSDVAPGRKTDPGSAFDWARLHRLLAPRSR